MIDTLESVGENLLGSGDIEEIVVTDGKLTVGYSYGSQSQAFLNDVTIKMVAPAPGFDYGKAYEEAGIEKLDASAIKVNAIQLFDLNGRRLSKAQKGITIVKKVMSDGSVKTEKVIVK